MTTKAGGRIHTSLNSVSRKEIPPVLHPTIVFSRVFNGRLELDTGSVTITAKTLIVAERTNPLILICNQTMRIGKQRRVVVTFEIHRFFFETMTFCTEFSSFPQFMNHGMG